MVASDRAVERRALGVSNPGGSARQFRVQYYAASQWRLYACFRTAVQARRCLDRLSQRGMTARLVPYQISPAA